MSLLPQATSLELAGQSFAVSEWRIRDILRLEQLLAGCVPGPLEGVPAEAGDGTEADAKARRAALLSAYARARDWPPRFGSAAWRDALATPRGTVAFLWVALSRENPQVTPDDIPPILNAMTAADWSALNAVLWAISPAKQILQQIEAACSDDGSVNDSGPHSSADWEHNFDHLARYYHLTYEQIGDLTLTQYGNYLRGGKREAHSLPLDVIDQAVTSDPEKAAQRAAAEAWLAGWELAIKDGRADDYPLWDAGAGRILPWSTNEDPDQPHRPAAISRAEAERRLAVQAEHPDWTLDQIRAAARSGGQQPATTADAEPAPTTPAPPPSDALDDRYVATFAAEHGLHADDVREAAAYLESVKATWQPDPERDQPQTAPLEHFGTSGVDVAAALRAQIRAKVNAPVPAKQPPQEDAQ